MYRVLEYMYCKFAKNIIYVQFVFCKCKYNVSTQVVHLYYVHTGTVK